MIKFLALILVTLPTFAQTITPSPMKKACGPPSSEFKVSSAKLPEEAKANSGSATVVIFSEVVGFYYHCGQITRVGIDGGWGGAMCLGQRVVLTLAPGDHHLCVDLQQKPSASHTALHSLHAEPGKVYYFRAPVSLANDQNLFIKLEPVDPDEGSLLLTTTKPSSVSTH